MAVNVEEGVPFEISMLGDVSGETWAGKFRAKEKLSFRDQIAIDKYRRELMGSDASQANLEVAAQCLILAELRYRLTDVPAWWKEANYGLDLTDSNVLQDVFNKAVKIQEDAVKRIQEAGEKAKQQLRDLRVEQK